MIIVDDKIIETPVKDIIDMLVQELAIRHIDKLDKIEIKQNNIRVTCPMHSGGHERTPSCDILMNDKEDVPAGTVKCFGCGYKASLVRFIADCLNEPYVKAKEWLLSVSSYSLRSSSRDIEFIDIDKDTEQIKEPTYVSKEELSQYEYIHPYMFKRKLTDEIIKKFEVGYDPKLDAITFPVYVNGKCMFVCKRRTQYKRFDMPSMIEKPIYGLDYITDNEIYVVESIINCLTLWTYGKQAVALFGTGSRKQLEQLKEIRPRKLILALDGDEAGRNGEKRIKEIVDNKIITTLQLPDGKDINDLSREEFDNLKEIL